MTFFPVLILLALIASFLSCAVLFLRSVRSRRYIKATLFAVPLLILVVSFANALCGFFQRSPQKVFRYALGFLPPTGCTGVLAYEDQSFNPGATIWLRFKASPDVVASIVSQAHFSTRSAQDFSDLQKVQANVNWWTPPRQGHFWQSSEFAGPYSFHDAGLAYDTNSQTAFIFVTAFD